MVQRLPRLGALVFFTSRLDACVEFYRLVGIPLVEEQHAEDGMVHFACELEGVHIAFFNALDEGNAPALRTAGCCFPGLAVASVSDIVRRVRAAGGTILQPPSDYPWGVRAVLSDPDGRPLEVFEPTAR